MNKNHLIDRLAPALGSRRAAADALDAVLDTIVRSVVAGESVSITGFGAFEPVHQKARVARNPLTGGKVEVDARTLPRFRPHQGFKDLTSGARPLPEGVSAIRKAPKGTYTNPQEAA